MSGEIMLAVLFGAVLHASWNALLKAGRDKFLDATLVTLGGAVIAVAALPFLPLPAPASWPFIGISATIHIGYYALVAAAYRTGDMSLAYPLMRGTAPLIVAVFSGVVLGEALGLGAWAGVVLICAGVLGLALEQFQEKWIPLFRPELRKSGESGANPESIQSGFARANRRQVRLGGNPAVFALANAVVIALYTFVDGAGARRSLSPVAYTLWLEILTALPFVAIAFVRRPAELRAHLAGRWPLGLVGGVCTLGSYALALWAMTRAPVAPVAALRETSILFGMVIAGLVLKERFGWSRYAFAALIVLGAVALRLA